MARIEKLDDLNLTATLGQQGGETWIFVSSQWTDRKTGEVTTRQRGYTLKQGTLALAASVTIERMAMSYLLRVGKWLGSKSRKPVVIASLWNGKLMALTVPAEQREVLRKALADAKQAAITRAEQKAAEAAAQVASVVEAAELVA